MRIESLEYFEHLSMIVVRPCTAVLSPLCDNPSPWAWLLSPPRLCEAVSEDENYSLVLGMVVFGLNSPGSACGSGMLQIMSAKLSISSPGLGND